MKLEEGSSRITWTKLVGATVCLAHALSGSVGELCLRWKKLLLYYEKSLIMLWGWSLTRTKPSSRGYIGNEEAERGIRTTNDPRLQVLCTPPTRRTSAKLTRNTEFWARLEERAIKHRLARTVVPCCAAEKAITLSTEWKTSNVTVLLSGVVKCRVIFAKRSGLNTHASEAEWRLCKSNLDHILMCSIHSPLRF